MNRRDFFKQGFKRFAQKNLEVIDEGVKIAKTSFKKETQEIKKQKAPILQKLGYPPGYGNEEDFLELCTGCGDCIEVCPYTAIFPIYDEDLEQQVPRMDVNLTPCMLCEDFPCIKACEEDALKVDNSPFFGRVEFLEHFCLNSKDNSQCSVCEKVCPEKAIDIDSIYPLITNKCIGCGICVSECPTFPKALKVGLEIIP